MNEIAYNYQRRMEFFPADRVATRTNMAAPDIANLNGIPLFSALTEKQLDWLRGRLYPCQFAENNDMIITGMPGDRVYFILSGTVKVYIPQPDGEEVIVAILGPGDPVGEMSIVDHGGRSANVITLEETQALWMSKANFKEALLSMPVMAQNMMRILSNRLRNSTGQIQAMAALDVSGRVIRQVLAFADRYGEPGPRCAVTIPIRLTQNDLAGLVGASRKRVNQAMVIFKHNNWLAVDGDYHITILDRSALETFLE